jgi:hypothetical protein
VLLQMSKDAAGLRAIIGERTSLIPIPTGGAET